MSKNSSGADAALAIRKGGPPAGLVEKLVEALLAVEWYASPGTYVRPACPACTRYQPLSHGIDGAVCPLDAALTAAGLPTQASRDEARREIAERGR